MGNVAIILPIVFQVLIQFNSLISLFLPGSSCKTLLILSWSHLTPFKCIHPCIHFVYLLIQHFGSQGSAGAYPSCQGASGRALHFIKTYSVFCFLFFFFLILPPTRFLEGVFIFR